MQTEGFRLSKRIILSLTKHEWDLTGNDVLIRADFLLKNFEPLFNVAKTN